MILVAFWTILLQCSEDSKFELAQTRNEKSTPSTRGQNSCYFGVELVWKVARRLTETDNIVITAYDQSKYLPKKPIGSVTVNLTELIKKQALNLEEFLVDSNKMVTNVFSLRSQVIARILPGKFIGEFLIDVRTIYESKGHALNNKWAVLIDPKNPLQGPVGYVRLDLAFLGKDEIPKHIKREKAADDENIEKDLLVPKGITNLMKRNITEFAVKLYRAEGLPPMNTDIITSIKQAFVGEGAPMCDPYVEVSFGGHSGKTKVKKYTYNPIWNQEIVFADFFPPLTHSIRLTVKDWDTLKDEEIATHIIDLKQLFNASTPNQLPSFGPSWVNLYGTPRTYTYEQMKRPHDELNRNLGEGVAFRGRLLMTIQAKPSVETMKTGAFSKATPAVSELVAGKKSPYFLFVAFYGISAVDLEIGRDKTPIQFEVSIGTYGNKIDGKKGGIHVPQVQPPRKDDTREKLDWNESLSAPFNLTTDSGAYYHVEFQGAQPCLYLLCEFEDHRLRMCIPNILEKLRDEYSDALDDSPDIPSHDDLLDFTRRFNEHILLGPTCGIPFSDEEDEEEEVETEDMEVGTTARFEDEMIKANRLLDDEAMANLTAPLDDVMSTADTRSVVSAASASTARRAARRKKQQQGGTVKYGLATPDLVRWRAETDLRVPETIRPPLGRFRLEVVFWGVRELRRQFLLPVNRPIITVEVGGTRVVSDLMQNAKINPLFEHHLKYVDLNLPLDDQYWPPITIMCHDYRMFGVRITVGLCTLPVATDFFEKTALVVEDEHAECSPIESDHEEKAVQGVLAKALTGFKGDEDPEDAERKDEEADQLAGGGFGPLRPQPTGGISSEESSEEDDSEKDTTEGEKQEEKMTAASTLTSESGTNFASHPANYTESDPILTADKSKPSTVSYVGRQGGFTPPGQVQQFQVNPMLKISKDLFSNLDWWSRLYATLNSMDDIDESSGDEDSTEEPDLFDEKLLQIEVSDNKAELEQGLLEVSEDELAPKPLSRKNRIRKFFRLKPKKELTALEKYEKKKAKERRKKKKKKKGEPSFVRKLRGDAKKAFDKELKESFYVTEEAELDETFIEKLEIYAMDLEEVPAFSGFTSPIRNFCLYRGKQDDDDVTAEERAVGYFKGNLMLYPVGEDEPLPQSVKDLKCFPTLPQTEYANVLVRVYIVRGFNLRPSDPSGTSDPFLVVSLGKQVFNEKDSYLKKTLRPTFGKMFQFDAKFPMDTTLHVQVFDHDIFGSNDLIGETVVDLEARYHSPHRPRCGLIKNFYSHGYAQWRDTQLPTKLLEDLCEQYGLPKPVYTQIENSVTVGQQKFFADSTIVDETGEKKKSNEPLALAALNNFEQLVPGNQLVPEHVEMRKLLHPEKGSLEQGRLMMWIDMFDKDLGRPPEPVDITPRAPEKWELRVIIHNTSDVVLNDTSLFSNERSSDIYVRGWLKGVGYDDQQTDVHYRSLSGEGNFNWRFVFPFDYVKQEDQITYQVKGPFDLESAEVKVPCELSLQGKVEAELQLVPGLDAENAPVGKGREDPDGLPPPNRPDSSFMSFMGPMNTIRYLIKYKLKWLLIKLLIAFLLILIVFLLIYTSPGWITKKIWNA
nr:unnamed protein product [Spirometra erinaceieuropaei]